MLIYLVGLIYWMCLFFDLLSRCVCVVLGVAYLVGFSCAVAMLLLVGVCKLALGGCRLWFCDWFVAAVYG